MRRIIFVGGIHGVGKTTICKQAMNHSSFHHLTASELIKNEKILKDTKMVKDVESNQIALLNALRKKKADYQNILLDGHFTLRKETGIEEITLKTFKEIAPVRLVLITEEPHKILENLKSRDNSSNSSDEIEKHQMLEIMHAEKVSKFLNIDLLKLTPNKKQEFYKYLEETIYVPVTIMVDN